MPEPGHMTSKRQLGQYYTETNPFDHPAFISWACSARLRDECVLEPFAGANSLIQHLEEMGLCRSFTSYDIEPADERVMFRNTLESFPEGYSVCVTNPPWLARNSASVRGLPFPSCRYDDLYKLALKRCLENCGHVAALVPESFIRAGLFQARLSTFVSLTSKLFPDTGHPVGLALFGPNQFGDVRVWSGETEIGLLSSLERLRPRPKGDGPAIRFNQPDGNVGLIALDGVIGPSIRFCDVEELDGYVVKPSGRHITKIRVEGTIDIPACNEVLRHFRELTQDVLLTSYKGIRRDGRYRRRLDWPAARGIIHHA